MSPLDWVECNVLHSWLLGIHTVMHLCWTGLQPNLLQHKHSWKLFEETNQWLNIALEEYQLIWQSLSMEWNWLQDNTSSGGPEKSLFCLVIAGYPGLGRPLFRNLIKLMQEHCQKLHPRSKDVLEKHQEILKVSWQHITQQKERSCIQEQGCQRKTSSNFPFRIHDHNLSTNLQLSTSFDIWEPSSSSKSLRINKLTMLKLEIHLFWHIPKMDIIIHCTGG